MRVQVTQETHDTRKKTENTMNTFMTETGLSA